MTGIYNRRHLVVSLEQEFNRCDRYGTTLSLIMLDLDHFKSINDNFGHEFGDYVLKEFAGLLQETVRQSDMLFRFGGEEFIVLLPQTDLDGAVHTAEKIRRNCAEKMISDGKYAVKMTVSIGVTSYDQKLHSTSGFMISYADEALYQAKENGRNQVVIYQEKNELPGNARS
ncbi:MAG: GGDEF domain-containing protein [Candidatus Electrothrix sp. MAN1_4]|nr:GGDEF domain-containing protein [Candidatus Electrothrix sp. MAN1_4]